MSLWEELFKTANINRVLSGVVAIAGSTAQYPEIENTLAAKPTADIAAIGGVEDSTEFKLSTESLTYCAAAGVAECQYLLGEALEFGKGMPQNIHSAKRYYELAYQGGYETAGAALLRVTKQGPAQNQEQPISKGSTSDTLPAAAIARKEIDQSGSVDLKEFENNGAQAKGLSVSDVGPTPIQMRAPKYPRDSAMAGQKGVVVVVLDIDAQGAVSDVLIVKSSRYAEIDAATLKAAKKWRFNPAIVGGRKSASRVHVPVTFDLSPR